MSCDGNCGKSSNAQDSDTWDAFIGRAVQGVIGYSDVYSGLGGGLGDWDGAGVVASGLFGKKKRKKGGGSKTYSSTYGCLQQCIINGNSTEATATCNADEYCCRDCNDGLAHAWCQKEPCPSSDGGNDPGGTDFTDPLQTLSG